MWQTDITHWQLAAGEHSEILNVIDDHSRLFICSHAYPGVKARDVVDSFHRAAALHGLTATLLSDNGAVFTGTARHGKVALQTELEQLGTTSASSTSKTASSYATSHSTPPAHTNPSQPPKLSTISRDTRPACPETQHNADERTRTSTWFPRHGPEPCASTNSATSACRWEAKISHRPGR
jgi:hypothetical protein